MLALKEFRLVNYSKFPLRFVSHPRLVIKLKRPILKKKWLHSTFHFLMCNIKLIDHLKILLHEE